MGLLDDILGNASPQSRAITEDVKRLNALQAGLGDKAASYVRKGENETVLSSVSTLCKANELEVCKPYIQDKSPTHARRKLLARGDGYDLDVMQRYAELLSAAAPATGLDALGSDKCPKIVRVFFTEAFRGLPDNHNSWPRRIAPLNGKGLTIENARALVRRLGGVSVDLIDVMYVKNSPYHDGGDLYREVVDARAFIESNPEDVKPAFARLPAAAKAELLRNIAGWKIGARFVAPLVEAAGETSKSVREAAISALASAPVAEVESLAQRLLQEGGADQRSGMVDLLARLGGEAALAALKAHRETEKTARIATAIDAALVVVERRSAGPALSDADGGYEAIGGARINIPPTRTPKDGAPVRFGEEDRAALRALIERLNEQTKKQNEENERRGHKYKAPMTSVGLADKAVDLFNDPQPKPKDNAVAGFLNWGQGSQWARSSLARLPEARALAVAVRMLGDARGALHPYSQGPASDCVQAYLAGASGDLRVLEQMDVTAGAEVQTGDWRNRATRPMVKGDYLRGALQGGYAYQRTALAHLPFEAIWPYLAENLDVFDEALGLKAQGQTPLDRSAAIRMLTLLPGTPARYYAPLLEAATSETKSGRQEARDLLSAAPEVDERLSALLDDTRQSVRAGAAEWLSQRRSDIALAALRRRLKKEKSEAARAAILTALRRLGEDLSTYVGPAMLIAEAEKGLQSAKLDKLAFLPLGALTALRFRDGAPVPNDVPRWWAALAFKLKQPGGNALFEIWLDQLDPKDAERFSTWILDSWIAYDTTRPAESEADAYAKAHAPGRFQMMARYDKTYTEERAFADLRREFLSHYLNSGADSKGLLALAARASSALAADRVRAYLKNHGSRTSQASALLEMLAGKGDPVALQVVIAAATRLKQKGVQKFAGELVTKIAEARDWTLEELADRTIPSAGFDDEGVLALPCGEDAKPYEARLLGDLSVQLRNPAGKDISSLPAGEDETTTASKKQLATTKKELKQIVAMQTSRLYEALCAERAWTIDDWRRCFHDHPVMRRLAERIVWVGVTANGAFTGAFRPTPEGDFTGNDDSPVDMAGFEKIRVGHGALLPNADAAQWEKHLADYEVKSLFAQFGRSLLRVSADDGLKTEIDDRRGWMTDAFTIRGAAGKLGYERGPALDGGFFNEYRKSFQSAGLAAVIEFTGNGMPEENVPAALLSLKFERSSVNGRSGAVRLRDVPPVLLSECWNDYRAMAAKAAFDPEWEKKTPW